MHVIILETSNFATFVSGLLTSRIAVLQSIEDCLKYVSMEKSDIFQAADTENLNKVSQLKEEDLKQIGIKLARHRNEMKKGIKAIIHYTEYYNKSVDDEAAIQTKARNVADSGNLYQFPYQ